MKKLYFYSNHDEKFSSWNQTNGQATSIVNKFIDEYCINFLIYKKELVTSEYLANCQNRISKISIRIILDSIGFVDRYANDGVELNKILLSNPKTIKLLVSMAKKDKNIAKYLKWTIGNYFKLFHFYYGELVLIESNKNDMDILPAGFKPYSFDPYNKVFYSKQGEETTKFMCELFEIKPLKGKVISLFPSALLIIFGQILIQSSVFVD
jgi:hypothetical protein